MRPEKPFRLVLDTNVVIDLLHFRDVRTAWLPDAVAGGRVRCFTDAACLAELKRVLAYPAFRLAAPERETIERDYLAWAERCEADRDATTALPRCRDADDQKFLELASRCTADALVTRDKELLRLARRRPPPPFAILTAEDCGRLPGLAAEYPARVV